VRFSSKGVKLSRLVHWADGVKEDGLTGFGFLTKDGFTGQDGQTGKKITTWNRWNGLKISEGKLRIL